MKPRRPDASPSVPAAAPRPLNLEELETRARYEMECLAYPAADWVPPAADIGGQQVHDVAIIGAGQSGLSAAFALRREGISRIVVLDRAPAGQEGPWENFARMPRLRTPKYLSGPDCGIPSLTFRAWYEAQAPAHTDWPDWDALERIPRQLWSSYLRWLRGFVDVDIRNGVEVVDISPTKDPKSGPVALSLAMPSGPAQLIARQVIVANGIDGGGAWSIPPALCRDLPAHAYAHSSHAIDFAALAGKRVAVLGIGASALDNAALALQAGAAHVVQCFRRPALPSAEVRAWLEQAGFLTAFAELDDRSRWEVMHRILGSGAPPPVWSLELCTGNPRFELRPASPWHATHWTGSAVRIETPSGPLLADFVIFGTGAVTRLDRRPELASLAPHVLLWRDREAARNHRHNPAADYPYLGAGFELRARSPGQEWLHRVRLFNWAATASLGISAASITGMKFGLRRLVPAVVRALYIETAPDHLSRIPWPSTGGFAPE